MPLGLTNFNSSFRWHAKHPKKKCSCLIIWEPCRSGVIWLFQGTFCDRELCSSTFNMSHKNALERKDSEFYPRRVNPNRRLWPKIPFSLKFPAMMRFFQFSEILRNILTFRTFQIARYWLSASYCVGAISSLSPPSHIKKRANKSLGRQIYAQKKWGKSQTSLGCTYTLWRKPKLCTL